MPSIRQVLLFATIYLSILACALPFGPHVIPQDGVTDGALDKRIFGLGSKKPPPTPPVAPVPTPPAKPNTTTSPKTTSTSPTSATCPVKSVPKRTILEEVTSTAKRALHQFGMLFARDDPEFIGFHGTNSNTAAFWEKQGFISKPPPPTNSLFDFTFGFFGPSGDGSSAADHELGQGLYIADQSIGSAVFASNNARANPGTTPKLCAIFAKSSTNWRTQVKKAFIPLKIVGDSANADRSTAFENARLNYVSVVNQVSNAEAPSVVKFSALSKNPSAKNQPGQIAIPNSITNQFSATCVDVNPNPAQQVLPPGAVDFSDATSYLGQTRRTEWDIEPENDTAAQCSFVLFKLATVGLP